MHQHPGATFMLPGETVPAILPGNSLPADSPSSGFVFDGTPKEDTVYLRLPADSPSSGFVFDGTPKEDTVCRPATDDDISPSPHDSLLVLYNGKPTKPRTARSKSVRYDTSETVSTPPAQRKQSDVPLMSYAKAAKPTSSDSSDLGTAAAGIEPESPVFTSASPVQQSVKSDLNVASTNAENDGKLAPKDKVSLDKVYVVFFVF